MSKTIFFDLETTDLHPVGQILNYAFVVVDEDWVPINKLTGNIKISRLQLPQPGAILANRIDVIKHQAKPHLETERDAMVRIREWIDNVVEREPEQVMIVGQNSAKFDIPFLRTSMIRNGVNPYFKNIIYGDMKFVSYSLAMNSLKFRKLMIEDTELRPFSLENQTKKLNLLTGEQKHESLADVSLTIALAQTLADHWDTDVRTVDPYEAGPREKIGTICKRVFPDLEDPTKIKATSLAFLESNKKYSLWVDIKQVNGGFPPRECVEWVTKGSSCFIVNEVFQKQPEAYKAVEYCKGITIDNYWGPKNCDVEQFIYMMPFKEMEALIHSIRFNNSEKLRFLKSKHGSVLYLRYKLANVNNSLMTSEQNEKFHEKLVNYALYRYGGKMKLSKFNYDSKFEKGIFNRDFHDTWNELNKFIEHEICSEKSILITLDDTSILERRHENIKLLESLATFYAESDIARLAGPELRKIQRMKLQTVDTG